MSGTTWENIGFYVSMIWTYISEGAKQIGTGLYTYVTNYILPALPSAMRIFSNRIVNLIFFVLVAGFFVTINIVTFCMFGADKGKAKNNKSRISEKKLMKMCFFGGAIGGFMGMLGFRHKTKKAKFFIIVPVLFIIQVILQSFVVGFLGFWAFFY